MMKIIQYALFLTLLIHTLCMGQQQIDTNLQNNRKMVEKLDFELLEKYARKTKQPSGFIDYYLEKHILDNGIIIKINGDTTSSFVEEQIHPLPAYWILYKIYDKRGWLKEKGKGLNDYYVKIGVWQYFDSNGNLIKEEDCDKRYGKFSYEQVLKFLREKEYLGEDNAGIENVLFYYDENKKEWDLSIYLNNNTLDHRYILDGTSGKVLEHKIVNIIE